VPNNAHVPSWGSFSYAFGPLVAVAVLVLLVVILRWAFARGQSVVAAPPRAGHPQDYGLLVAVAAPASRDEAELTATRLRTAGITASVADTTQGVRVMVWPHDAARAGQVLGTRQE
jgi:hypothetical protein